MGCVTVDWRASGFERGFIRRFGLGQGVILNDFIHCVI